MPSRKRVVEETAFVKFLSLIMAFHQYDLSLTDTLFRAHFS